MSEQLTDEIHFPLTIFNAFYRKSNIRFTFLFIFTFLLEISKRRASLLTKQFHSVNNLYIFNDYYS
jgi:hypothetical protein